MQFSFHFGWFSFHLDFVRSEQGGVGGGAFLNGQNPLRVTKVICQQYLTLANSNCTGAKNLKVPRRG